MFCSRLAIPYATIRPNGASASAHWSNTRPPDISSTTSTGLPSFASISAPLRSSSAASTAASAPSSIALARFSSVLAVAITRPAPNGFASCTARLPTPPAPEITTTDSPCASFALVLNRCHAVRPWISSASAAPSSIPSGIGKTVDSCATAYSA